MRLNTSQKDASSLWGHIISGEQCVKTKPRSLGIQRQPTKTHQTLPHQLREGSEMDSQIRAGTCLPFPLPDKAHLWPPFKPAMFTLSHRWAHEFTLSFLIPTGTPTGSHKCLWSSAIIPQWMSSLEFWPTGQDAEFEQRIYYQATKFPLKGHTYHTPAANNFLFRHF